jgi:hypothetical protein
VAWGLAVSSAVIGGFQQRGGQSFHLWLEMPSAETFAQTGRRVKT